MLSRLKGGRNRADSQSSGEMGGPSPRKSREDVTFTKSASLSPDRARSSRSNSINSNNGGGRRKSGNYNLEGHRYSVGGSTIDSGIGQGSLTMDQIQSTPEDDELETPTSGVSHLSFLSPVLPSSSNSDHDKTPIATPGSFLHIAETENGERSFQSSSNSNSSPALSSLVVSPNRARSVSSVSQRPQIYTSQAVGTNQFNGLSALAGINIPVLSSTTTSPLNSRSGSVNSRPDPDPVTKSTTSSRKSTLLSPPAPIHSSPTNSVSPTSTHSAGAMLGSSISENSLFIGNPKIKKTKSAINLNGTNGKQPSIITKLNRSSTTVNIEDEDTLSNYDPSGDFYDMNDSLGTGYAVASSKRNADFHALFKNISEDDYLIEDYGCALQREILIQGRIYISEHHLSFNANIFGWVTSHTLPFSEIVTIEKRMTAYVIPNAIQVTTLHSRHTFASFLSRDTTFDLIINIWRMSHPRLPNSNSQEDFSDGDPAENGHISENGVGTESSAAEKSMRRLLAIPRRDSPGDSNSSVGAVNLERRGSNLNVVPVAAHEPTEDKLNLLKNLSNVAMDAVFPSTPEKIYNLIYTSGFMREFWVDDQKLLDLQVSDWAPSTDPKLLSRSMTYIKPLSGSIGPRQTKCVILDENAHVDFDDYIVVISTTRTPDVPSGGSFCVKTRISITWAKGGTRFRVTTGVEWSKSSFIKGIIERSCIEGQKSYHAALELAMRFYIHQHRSEFQIGNSTSNSVETESILDREDDTTSLKSFRNQLKNGELYTRNRDVDNPEGLDGRKSLVGGLPGTLTTSKNLGEAALAAGRSAWEGILNICSYFDGTTSTGPIIIVFILIISNIYTFNSSRTVSPSREGRPGNFDRRGGEREGGKEVAEAVREVLKDWFKENGPSSSPVINSKIQVEVREELIDIQEIIAKLEIRLKNLKKGLPVLS